MSLLAYSSSTWAGFTSPDMMAKSSISSLLRVRTRLAVSPTFISSKVRFSIISIGTTIATPFDIFVVRLYLPVTFAIARELMGCPSFWDESRPSVHLPYRAYAYLLTAGSRGGAYVSHRCHKIRAISAGQKP